MVTDEQFGPVVIVSAGGVLIELLADRIAILPRLDQRRARGVIERLGIAPLLHGHRGSPAADVDSLAGLIARFSELAMDARDTISALDLNPVIVGPDGVVAVDVLVEWK
jgi:acyl-CoA synthetase (NDP forming)